MKNNNYTNEELEEIKELKHEAMLSGIMGLDNYIRDGEPLAILRQYLEQTPEDKKNYQY